MELRHLRYFVAAAEAENVSRAAGKLHLSQPALSRQIRDLEEELGFALFARSAKSIRLTEGGKAFLSEARAVLQRAEDAVTNARAVAAGGRGELHVGYAPSPTARILPGILRAFQGQWPKVRVKLHDLSTEEMLSGVREGELAMALMVRPTGGLLRGLRFEELTRDQLCLAVPNGHRFARLRSVAVSQVEREPLLVFNRKDYPDYHEHLQAVFAPTGVRLKIAGEHDSATSLVAAIESGGGVALVPRNLGCSTGRRLKLIALSPEPEPLLIGAVWSKSSLTPAAGSLLQAAREARLQLV
jgi:DNA-binding transcriptional LysR family regulator